MPAADAVAELVSSLGLPGCLRDVGVKRDQLDTIARESMHDRWVHTNPRRIDGPAVVRELLEAAWASLLCLPRGQASIS
jgi:maleylacetate reductase